MGRLSNNRPRGLSKIAGSMTRSANKALKSIADITHENLEIGTKGLNQKTSRPRPQMRLVCVIAALHLT